MGAKSDDSSQRLTLAQNQKMLDLIERQTQRAQRDVSKLFGSAEQNLLAGNQAAVDVMGQYAPQQFQALQQGNLNAQEQILAGMPQVTNALMGAPVDYSAFQTRTFTPDTSFLQNAQLPQFQSSQDALAWSEPEVRQEKQFSIDAALAGLPMYSKSDFKLGGLKSQIEKNNQFLDILSGLSPEAQTQLRMQGASAVGLGGDRGTALFNSLLSGVNPAIDAKRGVDKLFK